MGILCKFLSTIKDFKSKSEVLNICRMVVVSVCACLLVVGACNYEVLADEEKSTAVAKPEIGTLSTGEVNEVWIGDKIFFNYSPYGGIYVDIYSYDIEIIEGESVQVFKEISEYTQKVTHLGIECLKEGKSTIKVFFIDKNGAKGETVYSINVVEGKKIICSEYEKTVKLGDWVEYRFENTRYGSTPQAKAKRTPEGEPFYFAGGAVGFLGAYGRVYEEWFSVLGYAYQVGEFDIELDDGYTNNKLSGKVIVEEPVVRTNIPVYVSVGDKVKLETTISNVNKGLYANTKPEITIVDGMDCVSNTSGNDFLSTGDELTFLKKGTIVLNIKYSEIPDEIHDIPIVYEKTITIQVVDKDMGIVENHSPQDMKNITKETLNNILKNENPMTINCVDNGKTLYSWRFNPKKESVSVDVELGLSIGEKDSNVEKLTEGKESCVLKFKHHGDLPDNTSIKVLVSDVFKDVKAYVYHLESDGTATLTYEGMVKDGYIDIPLEHCSTYFVTKEKLKENSTEVSTKETTTKETMTKDTTAKQTTDNKEATKREEETTIAEQKTDKVTTESDSANNETTTTDMKENETTTTDSKEDDTTTTDVKGTDTSKLQDEVREEETPKKGNGGTIVAVIICIAVIVGVGGTALYLYLKKHK